MGEAATFTVEYEAFPEPSIQWQFSKNGGKKWSVIPGASEATLQVPNVTAGMNGYKYRVILDNGVAAPVQSEVATLTVTPGSANLAILLNSIYDRAGNVIHWTGTVTNAGPDSALNVIVNFVLPKNTKLSNIGTNNYQVKGQTIKINLGTIQTNSSVEFSVDVIPTSRAKFPIASTANATTTSLDENLTNTSVSEEAQY